jgi:hypothetical protein
MGNKKIGLFLGQICRLGCGKLVVSDYFYEDKRISAINQKLFYGQYI